MKYIALLTLVVLGLLTSCGIPKEILSKIEKDKRVMVDLPVDYYNLFPRLEYDKWDKDYNIYNKFLTKNIMSTQSWMAYCGDEVEIASCPNSVRTHVQLDTLSMITDKKLVIGEWRITR